MKRIKAKGRNGNVVNLGQIKIDLGLVTAASASPGDKEVVLDLVAQVTLTGKAARKAAKVLWGREKVGNHT